MTTQSASAFHDHRAAGMRGWSRLVRAFTATAEVLASIPQAAQAAALYQELSTLSDHALAKRGLKREDLPHYVFDSVLAPRD